MSVENTSVRNVPEAGRYEITVDGERAGFADYVDTDEQRIFHHTEIAEKFGGRGLAGALVSDALTDTRAAGKRVVPVCSYVDKYVSKHPEFGDIVDPVTPQAQAAVDSRR